jgi:hypothetical protein
MEKQGSSAQWRKKLVKTHALASASRDNNRA